MIQEEKGQPKNLACLHRKGLDVEMILHEESLNLDVTSFKKRQFFSILITNKALSESEKCKDLFDNVGKLFTELLENHTLEFTDNYILVFFVQVAYKSTKFSIKIEFPANVRQFKDESDKNETIFRKLQRLNMYSHLIPQIIPFQGDESNINYKDFKISEDKKIITGTTYQAIIINHWVYSFKIKIIQYKNSMVQAPICSWEFAESVLAMKSQQYLALRTDGQIIGGGEKALVYFSNPNIEVGSIITVEIDMNKKWISWYRNDNLLGTIAIFPTLASTQIYPIIVISNQEAQILHK